MHKQRLSISANVSSEINKPVYGSTDQFTSMNQIMTSHTT